MNMASGDQESTLVLVSRYGMGEADQELQLDLMGKWVRMVEENRALPGAIALYSQGVRLAARGSPVLEGLKALEAKGVRIILCKTCIDRFGLEDSIDVGIVGGMGDIVAAQTAARKVISL